MQEWTASQLIMSMCVFTTKNKTKDLQGFEMSPCFDNNRRYAVTFSTLS